MNTALPPAVMDSAAGEIETPGWLALATETACSVDAWRPPVSVAVARSTPLPAWANAGAACSVSPGLSGWESARTGLHVAPPSVDMSIVTEASGLPLAPSAAVALTASGRNAVAACGAERVTLGGETGPPPPASDAEVVTVVATRPAIQSWYVQKTKVYGPGPRPGTRQVPLRTASAGVPAAPVEATEQATFERTPTTGAPTDGAPATAVPVTSAIVAPLGSTRSIRPGELAVPPGWSSHSHWNWKLST